MARVIEVYVPRARALKPADVTAIRGNVRVTSIDVDRGRTIDTVRLALDDDTTPEAEAQLRGRLAVLVEKAAAGELAELRARVDALEAAVRDLTAKLPAGIVGKR